MTGKNTKEEAMQIGSLPLTRRGSDIVQAAPAVHPGVYRLLTPSRIARFQLIPSHGRKAVNPAHVQRSC